MERITGMMAMRRYFGAADHLKSEEESITPRELKNFIMSLSPEERAELGRQAVSELNELGEDLELKT